MSAIDLRCPCQILAAVALAFLAGCDGPPPPEAPVVRSGTSTEEAQQIARALTAVVGPPPSGFPVARTAAGVSLVALRGRFSEVALAGRAADGSLRTACVSSAAEAESFLITAAAAPDAGR